MSTEMKIVKKDDLVSLGNIIRELNGTTTLYPINQLVSEVSNVANKFVETQETVISIIDRSITKIKIPQGTTKIGAYTFAGCSELTEYDFSNCNSIPVLEDVNAFLEINPEAKIVVSGNLYNEWIVADGWNEYADCIVAYSDKEYSEGLEYECFDGVWCLTGLGTCFDTDIIIPNSVPGIEDSTVLIILNTDLITGETSGNGGPFATNCNHITSIVFPSELLGISSTINCPNCLKYDFSNCRNIPNISPSNNNEELIIQNINLNAKILVPSFLYDSWIEDENWLAYKDYIVSVEVPAANLITLNLTDCILDTDLSQFKAGDTITLDFTYTGTGVRHLVVLSSFRGDISYGVVSGNSVTLQLTEPITIKAWMDNNCYVYSTKQLSDTEDILYTCPVNTVAGLVLTSTRTDSPHVSPNIGQLIMTQ